jgi:serine/threonine protein kinase
VSDFIIDIEKEYEKVKILSEDQGIELWKDRKKGIEVVVKCYRVGIGQGDEVQQIFLREVEALSTLKHPCILKLKGFSLPNGSRGARIVSEFVGQGSLKFFLSLGCQAPRLWSVTKRMNAIIGIVAGMEYVHSKKFIHRDLKPENIFLDEEYRIRIGDLGSSRLVDIEFAVMTSEAGTPLYTAPEVFSGHYDDKVDIYSFGLILYELIVGDGLFSGPGSKMNLFVKLQTGWRPDIGSEVLKAGRDLIEKCWAARAEDRPSFSEIMNIMSGNDFELIRGSKISEVKLFLAWLEEEKRSMKRGNPNIQE